MHFCQDEADLIVKVLTFDPQAVLAVRVWFGCCKDRVGSLLESLPIRRRKAPSTRSQI